MAQQLIRDIERILLIRNTYTVDNLVTYLLNQTEGSTTEITAFSRGNNPAIWPVPGSTTSFGSIYGLKTTTLSTTINATDLVIQAPGGALATWPDVGYIYFAAPAAEGIYYSDIISWNTTGTGFDHIIVPAVSSRGWSGTAQAHTATVTIYEILPWFVRAISLNPDSNTYNVSTRATQFVRTDYLPPDESFAIYTQDKAFSGSLVDYYELLESSG
tara:strand:- start:99 stop:743 length:645 start_codon:yes stop_codon:yes gene_type:complete